MQIVLAAQDDLIPAGGAEVDGSLAVQEHTAYGRARECVSTAVESYLLTGVPPEDGTTCRGRSRS